MVEGAVAIERRCEQAGEMNLKIVIGTLVIGAAVVIGALLLSKNSVQSKYKVGDCFTDKSLGVKFRVADVAEDRYDLVVVASGHYQSSPEYAKDTALAYSREAVDGAASYHSAFCEGETSDSIPNQESNE